MLGWLEMQEEDQPDESIWLDPDAITGHFEAVRERYAAKAQGHDTEPADLHDNELTRGLRR